MDIDTSIPYYSMAEQSISIPDSDALNNKGSIVDFRNGTNHPCSLLYSEIYKNALLTGKLIEGRVQPGFNIEKMSPFVLAAKSAVAHGVDKDGALNVIKEILSRYYGMVKPKSAAEWLGLDIPSDNILQISPPWAAVFPWRARTIESYRQAYEKAALAESEIFKTDLDINKGWVFCGPCSPEKIEVEALRIYYVLKQISQKGYKRSNHHEGDVIATALVDETLKWRWLLTSGSHRASAASALGYDEIPIRVNLVIRRDDVKFWPNVVNGLYSESNALNIFDRFFSGCTPSVTQDWELAEQCNYVYRQK